jgi:hypothetical protein
VINLKKEYQGEMHWESIQIFQTMFIEKKWSRKENMRGVRSFGPKLFQWLAPKKERERDHLHRWIAKMEIVTSLRAKGKVTHESHARSAWCDHGETLWWKDNKKVVGENFLLASSEGTCRTLHPHLRKVPK